MAERERSWRDVRAGATLVALLLVALLAFWLNRGRNPFAEQYTLFVFLENAKGLHEGAPVRLSGVTVGEVVAVHVLGPGSAIRARYPDRLRNENIQVVLEVSQDFSHDITEGSVARVASQGASGERYVSIEKGPVGNRPLGREARVPLAPSLDVEYLIDRGADVIERIESLNQHAAAVREKMKTGGGTLGRFMANPSDNEVAENFEDMNLRAARVLRSIESGGGTIALERRTRGVRRNLEALRTSVQEIARAARRGGTLGGLAGDTALSAGLRRLEGTLSELDARLATGHGSLGRFMNDAELFDQITTLQAVLDSLATQVKEDPLGSVDIDLH